MGFLAGVGGKGILRVSRIEIGSDKESMEVRRMAECD